MKPSDRKYFKKMLQDQRDFVDRELLVQALLERYQDISEELFNMYFSEKLREKLTWTGIDQEGDFEQIWEIFEEFADMVQNHEVLLKKTGLVSIFELNTNKRKSKTVSIEDAIENVYNFPAYGEI
jgi:hypothetical protein